MEESDIFSIAMLIIVLIIIILIIIAGRINSMRRFPQIPYSKNPPMPRRNPQPTAKRINNNHMSYNNSNERVQALEALARAYGSIESGMVSSVKGESAVSLLEAIKAEVELIKVGQGKDK